MILETKNSIVKLSEQKSAYSFSELTENTGEVFSLHAENTNQQVFILNTDFKFTYISPSVEGVSGYTQEEFKLLKPEEYLASISYEKAVKSLKTDFNGRNDIREKKRLELQIVQKCGALIWVETFVKFILDENDQPIGITGYSHDITKRKQFEENLKISEEKYRLLTESLNDVVLVVSPELIIEYISPLVSDFCGYLPEEIKGTHIFKYFAVREEYDIAIDHFRQSFKEKGMAANYYFLLDARNRKNFYIEITATPAFKNGRIVMTQCIARDISERKEIETRLHKETTLSVENLKHKNSIIKNQQFCDIIGKSQAMLEVYEMILKAVSFSANIIIYGESGTGKEITARAIHKMSDRHDKPFVIVNCGAISENIIESEFFGYKKGAFTGAVRDNEGFLDMADGGTLFLDEIGEISLNMQVKLLRAIEGGGYSPVGSNQLKKTKFHIVAATNRNLHEMVAQNKMREDFFYRIHVIPIHLPPLRKRKEDIPLLMDYFLTKYRKDNIEIDIPLKVKKTFMNYHWPGNVRELQNVLYRYLALKKIEFMDIYGKAAKKSNSLDVEENFSFEDGTLSFLVEQFEKNIIKRELDKTRWNKSRTALSLNIDRKTLSSKIKKYQLNSE